jgi:hypothetical protein
MLRKFLSLAVVLIAIGFYSAGAFAESEFVYRNEESIEAMLTEKLSARIIAKLRFTDEPEHSYNSTDMELNYKFRKWLFGGVAYRKIYTLGDSLWSKEDRTHLQGTLKWAFGGWKLGNRVRLEYRNKQDADAYLRFRDKLELKSPWKLSGLEANPYVADEIFIEEGDGFNANRIYAGTVLKLSEHIFLNVYYLLEIKKGEGDWDQYVHAPGTTLRLKY